MAILFTTINGPAAISTDAYDINDVSQIVGAYDDGSGPQGFLLSGGHYTTLNDPSALTQLTKATGINASGQIVGIYNPLLGQRGFSYNGRCVA
jgi:hypothetical protein